jgi:hypothetical protein
MKIKTETGQSKWAWSAYAAILNDKEQHIQVTCWPNGEGFDVYRPDDSYIHMDWDEWNALKATVAKL